MFFGFLSEFWNAIVDVTVAFNPTLNELHYSVLFFQMIGNAIAGSLGAFGIRLVQPVIDFFLAIMYLVQQIGTLTIGKIVQPILYMAHFLDGTITQLSIPMIEARYNLMINSGEYVSLITAIANGRTFLGSVPALGILSAVAGTLIFAMIGIWFFKVSTS